ncbi:MAG: hypothetical protein HDT47_04835 [Ruminococcaceae bacterium]|nr:hypothetical protein [Oscillospiraceae bacterium]
MIDTGKKTYRYRVKKCDAEKFKERMERDSGFLVELKGRFGRCDSSSDADWKYALKDDEREEFREFLTRIWKKYPDALPAKEAAELVGVSVQRVNELVRKGVVYGMCVGNVQYLSKEKFVEYVAGNCRGGELVVRFRERGGKV